MFSSREWPLLDWPRTTVVGEQFGVCWNESGIDTTGPERRALAGARDVGAGGHYLGHLDTQADFERAFFKPKLFDNNSIKQWQAEGSVEIIARALDYARKLLREYDEPKFDNGIDEALRDDIAHREREIPVEDALNTEC